MRLPAPPLDGGVEWVNTAGPLTLADLRGRFVLLDFWTYCCINCMHVLPELKKLEHAFPNELVVIGVHSAKFEGEQDTENIREAVLRYEIEHPVVNDAKMAIWRRYGARSWPTLVLIDPAGEVVWAAQRRTHVRRDQSGDRPRLAVLPRAGIAEAGAAADVARRAEAAGDAAAVSRQGAGRRSGGRLFIADSNHNRIVVDESRRQVAVRRSAAARSAAADGAFDACELQSSARDGAGRATCCTSPTPRITCCGRSIWRRRQVTTIAGTGEKGDAWARVRRRRIA